jgi:hypothetical protein
MFYSALKDIVILTLLLYLYGKIIKTYYLEENMYTYESFVHDGTFTLMRPVFFTLLIASIVLFSLIIIPKTRRRLLNVFSVLSLSFIFAMMAVQVIYYDAIIVDEIGLGGDAVSTLTSIIILAFSVLNPIVFLSLKSKITT